MVFNTKFQIFVTRPGNKFDDDDNLQARGSLLCAHQEALSHNLDGAVAERTVPELI